MASAVPVERLDLEGWVAHEATAAVRHELVGGRLFARTEHTLDHSLLAGAFFVRIRLAAVRHGCRAYLGGARTWTGQKGYYPDVMVACSPRTGDEVELAPCFVLEVLSPSTERTDLGGKLAEYTAMPSVRTYAIAATDRVRVEVHERTATGWTLSVLGAGDVLAVTCLGLDVSLDEVYAEI